MRRDPASALANVAVDAVVPSELVGSTIAAMGKGEDPPPPSSPEDPDPDPPKGEQVNAVCPECGGVLTENAEAGVLQRECHVGHRFSPDTLADAQADSVEWALWAAVRVLADRAALLGWRARQAESSAQTRSARRFRRQSQAAADQSELVRQALARAAGTTLRRVSDSDEEDHPVEEEGAA